MSRHFRAEIRENIPLNTNHNILTLRTPPDTPKPYPGQFYMLEVSKGSDPLLKRAFSLCSEVPGGFMILYRIRGKGTEILRDLKEGASVDMLGPLGTPYPPLRKDKVPVIIAGGIGIASVFSLIELHGQTAYVFYGARTKTDLLLIDRVKSLCKEVYVSTDDGTEGEKGTIIPVLDGFLSGQRSPSEKFCIYACGPQPMLREVGKTALAREIETYVSLEEHMACGIGACLGCVVKTRFGYKRVCKEGPVFDAREFAW